MNAIRGLLPALTVALLPALAWAGSIKPAGITASSTYPETNGVAYDAAKIADGKLSSAWVEGETGAGLGAWVELDLGGSHKVHEVRIYGGMWYSGDYWQRGERPKELEISYSDGTKDTFPMKDEMKVQKYVLPTPKDTTTVRVRVKSVYDGTTWLDTGISEIQVLDAEPDGRAPVRTFSASSVLAADADGTYDAANAGDGLSDSMWCEGSKDGDGTGEYLDFAFAGAQKVSKLTLIDGIGSSMSVWMKANRATTATLTFSDGSKTDITVKNSMLPQTITFPAVTTSSARLTFTTVVKGKEFNDLCISEAYFAQ